MGKERRSETQKNSKFILKLDCLLIDVLHYWCLRLNILQRKKSPSKMNNVGRESIRYSTQSGFTEVSKKWLIIIHNVPSAYEFNLSNSSKENKDKSIVRWYEGCLDEKLSREILSTRTRTIVKIVIILHLWNCQTLNLMRISYFCSNRHFSVVSQGLDLNISEKCCYSTSILISPVRFSVCVKWMAQEMGEKERQIIIVTRRRRRETELFGICCRLSVLMIHS